MVQVPSLRNRPLLLLTLKKKILFQLLLLIGFIITSREFSSLQGVEEKRDRRMFELKF